MKVKKLPSGHGQKQLPGTGTGQADGMESDHDKGLSLSDIGSPGGFVCTATCEHLYVLLIFVLCL